MREWLLPRPGSWRDMVFGEAFEPSPAQGDIRVAVHAVGLNRLDYKIARMGHPDWRFPHILGLDVAGVVDANESSVRQWQPGDRVFYHGDLSKPGGFAELAVTTAHTVARVPVRRRRCSAVCRPHRVPRPVPSAARSSWPVHPDSCWCRRCWRFCDPARSARRPQGADHLFGEQR